MILRQTPKWYPVQVKLVKLDVNHYVVVSDVIEQTCHMFSEAEEIYESECDNVLYDHANA